MTRAQPKAPTVSNSLREYARGIAGGLMFSLPLLYTMEVWWAGFVAQPAHLLIYLATGFVLLLGYNNYAGLHHDACWSEVAIDSVEEMGLGLLLAASGLFLLGRIELGESVFESVGKITVEAMTIAIGISVGTAQLGGSDGGNGSKQGAQTSAQKEVSFGGQMIIACCGAVLFAANVAPTEEIVVIAAESHLAKLVGIAAVSLVLTALILHYIEFRGSERFVRGSGTVSVLIGTVTSYAVALLVSAAVLWFFGRFDSASPLMCVSETIVLGLASTLGASAGRLLVQ